MKILKKTNLWRGLTAVLALLLAVIVCVTVIANENFGSVNSFLKVDVPTNNYEEGTMYYPTDFSEDGIPSADSLKKLIEAEDAYNKQTMEEGAVLVKNNGALPLEESERKVTLFGRAVADSLYRGISANSDPEPSRKIDLPAALKAEGFEINETVYNALSRSSVSRNTSPSSAASIGEVPASFYTQYQSSFDEYSDVAIVMFAREGGEGKDLQFVDADGVRQLSLHQQEADLLKMIKDSGKFRKTIVLINSGWAMELGFVEKEEYGVDACLWIGGVGVTGFTGVASLLVGKANPSGKFVDIYAENSMSSAAAQNAGDFSWANLATVTDYIETHRSGTNYQNYLIEAEGIYVGYKYYETRYQDQVLGINNATSSKGVYESENNSWDYADEVTYPFGYGLSYTEFTQTLDSVKWDRSAKTVTAEVTVENTGSVAGKSVVQLYAQLPYTQNNVQKKIEKSAIQVIGFEKTGIIEPGKTEKVTITVDEYLFATYDSFEVKGYIYDEGDYYFAIGDDSHDALNNILAARGESGMFDQFGKTVAGDADKAVKETLSAKDTTTYANSQYTGEKVSNKLDFVDFNTWVPGTITYMTRSDWNTFPQSYTNISAPESMFFDLDGKTYSTPDDAPSVDSFELGVDYGEEAIKMVDLHFDDEYDFDDDEFWNKFLNQLSYKDLVTILNDNWGIPAILSVGKPYSKNEDGPDSAKGSYKSEYGGGITTLYVSECVLACTWNKELVAKKGYFLGEDALHAGHSHLWSPGSNLHRTPYSGRNFEYWSEDSIMTYIYNSIEIPEMQAKGLISALKHLCANDQETNRVGVSTFMTEQAMRQGPLKGFEGAFTVGGALSTMTSYNRVGPVSMCQSGAIQNEIMRGEWGFKGFIITDAALSANYMRTIEAIVGGTDMFCIADRSSQFNVNTVKKDGYILQCLRESSKRIYYVYAHSNLINGLSHESEVKDFVAWWQNALLGVEIGFGILTGVVALTYVVGLVLKKRDEKGGNN